MESARVTRRLLPAVPGWPNAAARRLRGSSGQAQEDADESPDTDQRRQDPEQEGGLAEGQPRQLLASEREARSANGLPTAPELCELACDGRIDVLRGQAVGVNENNPLSGPRRHADTVPHVRTIKTSSVKRLRRAGIVSAAVLLGVVAGALIGGPSHASGAVESTILLATGDVVRVVGAPVGCRVVVRGVPRATMLDCRRAGPLAGTYGVLLGPSNVRVVRFESGREARLVFTAKHGGAATCCGSGEPR